MESNPLLGTWKLKSYVVIAASGARSTPYGQSPRGYVHYAADGRMQVIGAAGERRIPAGATATDDERLALYDTLFAYAGTYTIGAGEVTHHVDLCWNEVWTGTDQVRRFEVRGKTLTLTMRVTDPENRGETQYVATWEKVAASGVT